MGNITATGLLPVSLVGIVTAALAPAAGAWSALGSDFAAVLRSAGF